MNKFYNKVLLAASFLLFGCSNVPVSEHWSEGKNLSDGRSEISAAELDGVIYVAGGIGKFRMLKSCEAFTIKENAWRKCPDLPRKLHHVAMASDGTNLFAAGGYVTLRFKHLMDPKLWRLSADGKAWIEVTELPGPIGEHVMVSIDKHLFLIGGSTPEGDTGDVWRFDKESGEWDQMAAMPTPRNSMAAIVSDDNEIWLLGGRSSLLGSKIDRVEIYNPAEDEWRKGPDLPLGRGGHSAAYLNGQIHVFGGETFDPNKMVNRHDVYDLESGSWVTADPAPRPRHGMAAVTSGKAIYVLGGGSRPGFKTIYSASAKVQVWRAEGKDQ